MRRIWILAALVTLFGAGGAHADPCEAIPEGGPAPAAASYGASFAGPVAYVIDGDSFCVALGEGPKTWVEVRLGDFYAVKTGTAGATAKAALERIALGKQATCVANLQSGDRVAARCSIDGKPVGDSLRTAGVAEEDLGSVASPVASRSGRRSAQGSAHASQSGDVLGAAQGFRQGVASGLKRAARMPMIIP